LSSRSCEPPCLSPEGPEATARPLEFSRGVKCGADSPFGLAEYLGDLTNLSAGMIGEIELQHDFQAEFPSRPHGGDHDACIQRRCKASRRPSSLDALSLLAN